MRYDFIECIFNNCGYDKAKWKQADATKVKKSFVEGKMLWDLGLAKTKISKEYFNKVRTFLNYFVVESEDGKKGILGRDETGISYEIDRLYSKEYDITLAECIYLCFVLKENNLYSGNLYKLYEQLISIAGIEYDIKKAENMRAAILFYVLENDKTVEDWKMLNASWSNDCIMHEKKWFFDKGVEITYYTLTKILDTGFQNPLNAEAEQERSTAQSGKIIMELFQKLRKLPCKGQTIREIFGDELIEHIENSEDRRRWYFLKITHDIVKSQIDRILYSITEYKNRPIEQSKKNLIASVKESWIEKEKYATGYGGYDFAIGNNTWLSLANHPKRLIEIDINNIKKDLEFSKISIEKVYNSFNLCFEGTGDMESPNAMANLESRLVKYLNKSLKVESKEFKILSKIITEEELKRSKYFTNHEREIFLQFSDSIKTSKGAVGFFKKLCANEKEEDVQQLIDLFFEDKVKYEEMYRILFLKLAKSVGNSEADAKEIYESIEKEEANIDDIALFLHMKHSNAKLIIDRIKFPQDKIPQRIYKKCFDIELSNCGISNSMRNYIWKELIDESKVKNREGREKISNIFNGKKCVTREMLLMIWALNVVIGGDSNSGTMDYLTGNILMNSRYDGVLKETPFEQFIRKFYERIGEETDFEDSILKRQKILQEESGKMEMQYLIKSIAPYSEILSCKHIG